MTTMTYLILRGTDDEIRRAARQPSPDKISMDEALERMQEFGEMLRSTALSAYPSAYSEPKEDADDAP